MTPWANQGVLLLNTSLTVQAGVPNSHKGMWEEFMIAVINSLRNTPNKLVFLLWGGDAKELYTSVTQEWSLNRHTVLLAGHPATASKGKDLFSGCNHFSKTNYYFWRQGLTEINWRLNGV